MMARVIGQRNAGGHSPSYSSLLILDTLPVLRVRPEGLEGFISEEDLLRCLLRGGIAAVSRRHTKALATQRESPAGDQLPNLSVLAIVFSAFLESMLLRFLSAALAMHLAAAYLSPMCCGDNFCCAVKTDTTVSCWGNYSFGTVVPSSYNNESNLSGIKYIACGGRTLVAVDTSDQIAAIMGKPG